MARAKTYNSVFAFYIKPWCRFVYNYNIASVRSQLKVDIWINLGIHDLFICSDVLSNNQDRVIILNFE